MSKILNPLGLMERSLVLVFCFGAVIAAQAQAQSANPLHSVPSALLSVDQNRNTIVDRVVGDWGEALANSSAGITIEALRSTLLGMRADYLLAASIAGSLEGLRNVIASSVIGADSLPSKPGVKLLGDSTDDLVYTPVVPCRIVDTRNVGGAFAGGGETRSYHAYLTSGTFATQGGAASTCGIPANPAAAALNITTVGGGGFLTAWPFGAAQPNASTLNPNSGIVANGAIVPLCQPNCTDEFSIFTYAAQVVIDIVGYFAAPVASALICTVSSSVVTIPAGPSATQVSTTASCGAGDIVTGGGCAFGDASNNPTSSNAVLLNRSTRFFDGTNYLNEWACGWTNTDTVNAYKGNARAMCCHVPGR